MPRTRWTAGQYPPNWKQISDIIRFERARGRCEWCNAPHGRFIRRWALDPARWRLCDPSELAALAAGERLPPAHGWLRPVRIVLTVAHLNHDPHDCDGMHTGTGWLPLARSNLAALCQRCHLGHDAQLHAARARVTRAARAPSFQLSFEADGRSERLASPHDSDARSALRAKPPSSLARHHRADLATGHRSPRRSAAPRRLPRRRG